MNNRIQLISPETCNKRYENKWPSCLLGMADRIASNANIQGRGVKVKIRINVPVRVNPV